MTTTAGLHLILKETGAARRLGVNFLPGILGMQSIPGSFLGLLHIKGRYR